MDPVSEPPPFDALEDRILPWSQVRVICGLSRTTVWRMQKSGDFPACVQVSRNPGRLVAERVAGMETSKDAPASAGAAGRSIGAGTGRTGRTATDQANPGTGKGSRSTRGRD